MQREHTTHLHPLALNDEVFVHLLVAESAPYLDLEEVPGESRGRVVAVVLSDLLLHGILKIILHLVRKKKDTELFVTGGSRLIQTTNTKFKKFESAEFQWAD